MQNDSLNFVELPVTYEIDTSFDNEKFIKMRMRIAHDGENPNKSSFKVEDLKKAEGSIKNIPILANVIFDEDGNPQFGGHDMSYEPDKTKEGEYKVIYKETPIGVVPENCNYTIEKFNDKNYVFADAFIWRGYSNYAENIIDRDAEIKISMEAIIDGYSYNAKEKIYNITDFRYSAITLLNKDFGTGMKDALATTGTFEQLEFKEKFIMMMEELKSTLSDCNINTSKEGGNDDLNEKLELVAKYNLTVESLEFNLEDFTVEEIELKLKEFVESNNKKDFSATYNQKRDALRNALDSKHVTDSNGIIIESTYFYVMDFDDTFVYVEKDFWSESGDFEETHGRFSYSFDEETLEATITSDWEEMYLMWLTADEKKALDDTRGKYEVIVAEYEEYKNSHSVTDDQFNELKEYREMKMSEERVAAEQEIFEHFDKQLNGKEEYENLKLNSKDYDVDALEKECYFILGKFTANFSAKKEKKVETIKLPVETTIADDSYCGGIIERYTKK